MSGPHKGLSTETRHLGENTGDPEVARSGVGRLDTLRPQALARQLDRTIPRGHTQPMHRSDEAPSLHFEIEKGYNVGP